MSNRRDTPLAIKRREMKVARAKATLDKSIEDFVAEKREQFLPENTKVIKLWNPHENQLKLRASQKRYKVILCGRRFGKALALDTPILTTKGFKNLIEVSVGDYVYGEDGNQHKVLYKSPVYRNRTCYRVVFSDGSSIIADASHDWVVEDKKLRKSNARNKTKKLQPQKLTTEEIAQKLFIKRSDGGIETNYSIPTTKPLRGAVIDFPIEPYFLGLWLGDGNSNSVGVTTADNEVVRYLYEYAERRENNVVINYQKNNASNVYAITGGRSQGERSNSLQAELTRANLIRNKHIPEQFFTASYEQRLDLLRGLMDSDGTCTNGFYEYTSINSRLADDVKQLLLTFGIKVGMYIGDAKLYGVWKSKKYRLCFSTDIDIFNLSRKKAQQKAQRKPDIKRRFIIAVEQVDSVPVQCLMVDNPTHLFLCGKELIPTHNTHYAVNTLLEQALTTDDGVFWYVAPTYRQAKMIAWDMLNKAIQRLPNELVKKTNESELSVVVGNNSRIEIKGADNPDSLRGVGLNGIILDEYADIRPQVFGEIIRPALTDKKGWATFIGTPKGFNHFYELYTGAQAHTERFPTELWDTFHFTSYDNPLLDKGEIEEARISMDPDKFAQEYLADFRKAQGLVYANFTREQHVFDPKTKENTQWIEVIAGVDFGYNNPASIIVIGRDFDNRFYVLDEWYYSKRTTDEITEAAKNLQKKYAITKFYPDPASPAAIEDMRRAGINVRDANKDVILGIDHVRTLLNTNRLFVAQHCINTIYEFEAYMYPEQDISRSKLQKNEFEKPVKENDHALDALRYALFTYEPIQQNNDLDFGLYATQYY